MVVGPQVHWNITDYLFIPHLIQTVEYLGYQDGQHRNGRYPIPFRQLQQLLGRAVHPKPPAVCFLLLIKRLRHPEGPVIFIDSHGNRLGIGILFKGIFQFRFVSGLFICKDASLYGYVFPKPGQIII